MKDYIIILNKNILNKKELSIYKKYNQSINQLISDFKNFIGEILYIESTDFMALGYNIKMLYTDNNNIVCQFVKF